MPHNHAALTTHRTAACNELFGCTPFTIFQPQDLFAEPDANFPIDVIVYTLATSTGDIEVAVTSGMSDRRLIEPDYDHEWKRRELIQYFPKCTADHARRLHDMAWLPLFDGFYLDYQDSIAWQFAAIEGTPWTAAFFLLPLIKSHREFVFEVEGDPVSFLWHIPITHEERAFKQEHGPNALLDRMEAVDLPWVFDENNRPALVE